MNALKTIGLMIGLTLIPVWAGAAFGGRSGMTMALIFALMMMEERSARLENMEP